MNINHLNQDKYYEQIGYNRRKKDKGNFEQDFLEKAFENVGAETENVSAAQINFYEYYQGLSTKMGVGESGRVFREATMECAARNISYAESDNVKTFVTEGFVLKAQVHVDEQLVYIEQKNEDGTVQGYEVDPLKVPVDTTKPIEQMAVESWEEALAEFYDFVEDRIKNGPPKYRLGSGEWSIEEWEKLIDKIDEDIETVKEELRERIDKQKVEYEEKRRLEQAEIKDSDIDKILRDRDESIPVNINERFVRSRFGGEEFAPYSLLADENGIVTYKGVCFVCDDKNNTISLGDMSNPDNVMNISLPSGGTLRVNYDNLDDLAKAIDMFSPEDINAIMRAIAQDKHCKNKLQEIENLFN